MKELDPRLFLKPQWRDLTRSTDKHQSVTQCTLHLLFCGISMTVAVKKGSLHAPHPINQYESTWGSDSYMWTTFIINELEALMLAGFHRVVKGLNNIHHPLLGMA